MEKPAAALEEFRQAVALDSKYPAFQASLHDAEGQDRRRRRPRRSISLCFVSTLAIRPRPFRISAERWKTARCPTRPAFGRHVADLSSVPDPGALANLPTAERQEWQAFWTEVDGLLKDEEKGESR
ncbi:MAG TPA: hypothetical protein VMS17_23040 [Gemmataceae bacterium]|nr:hypothetical protein [Gemmataceae bacterium]